MKRSQVKRSKYEEIINCFDEDNIIEMFEDGEGVELVSSQLSTSEDNYKQCDISTGQKCFRYDDIYYAILRMYVEEYMDLGLEVQEELKNITFMQDNGLSMSKLRAKYTENYHSILFKLYMGGLNVK